MSSLALLIDFGSTYTKVTAVDLDMARIVGRAQAPSTVATDVCEGLLDALMRLTRGHRRLFGDRPRNLDALLDGAFVRASSSAAGGLRIVVVGHVPGLTVEAANAAALGAGGKVVGAFGFRLRDDDIADISRLNPDMVLLTGGTDGGDAHTIRHNAALLARSVLAVPFIVAGNNAATGEIAELFAAAGKDALCTGNVMPEMNRLQPQPAQNEIRRLFMREIVRGKGLDRIGTHVPIVLPTPMAVLEAALLGSRGIEGQAGCGNLLLVDVGGATTDVHSIGFGRETEKDIIPKGLPESFAKRTVEGDLGVRCNATTILKRAGEEGFLAQFRTVFPELAVAPAELFAYIHDIAEDTGLLPQSRWQAAADAVLARIAIDIAITRHVGTREPYFAREGTIFVQSGKDLTDVPFLIGTGGVFLHNPYADRILVADSGTNARREILRPSHPRVCLDRDYVLFAVGLLAESHPAVALQIFRDRLGLESADGEVAPFVARGNEASHGPFCACCSDTGLSYSGVPAPSRSRPLRGAKPG